MNGTGSAIAAVARQAVLGAGSHTEMNRIFMGLDWRIAGKRPRGATHSVYQLLSHIMFWQDWAIRWLDGENPQVPEHAEGSWPGGVAPASAAEWEAAVQAFDKSLDEMQRRCRGSDLLAKRKKRSRLSIIQTIGAHNSYHGGQAVLLRRMLGAWPPPGGGLTW